jgi:hypothetical protein
MRFVLIIAALAALVACSTKKANQSVPAEVQFVRDEAARFQQYTDLVNRQKEDAAAVQSFVKLWDTTICKKRDQQLIALGDRVACGNLPASPATPQTPPAPKTPEKK